jgi:hypothetical protein
VTHTLFGVGAWKLKLDEILWPLLRSSQFTVAVKHCAASDPGELLGAP